MAERDIGLEAREHFEELWRRGDPWDTRVSEFEQAKYDREFDLIKGRDYQRVLEIGCGSGSFTRRLATIADHVLALDIAESALALAGEAVAGCRNVELRAVNIMEWDPSTEEPWDLITLLDTVDCFTGTYSFVDIACLAARLFSSSAPGGRLLVADPYGDRGLRDVHFRPWLIRTYRDLLRNVGYRAEREDFFRGVKNDVELTILISLFHKSPADAAQREQLLW
jgi:SAM-dependent methyltransferase